MPDDSEAASEGLDVTISVTPADLAAMTKVITNPDRVNYFAEVAVRAGAMELLALATGRAVFSAMSDLRQYRVYLLLLCGLDQGEAPDVVRALFQSEASPAMTLVNKTLARYRVELREGWFELLGTVLAGAKFHSPNWTFSLTPFQAARLEEPGQGGERGPCLACRGYQVLDG